MAKSNHLDSIIRHYLTSVRASSGTVVGIVVADIGQAIPYGISAGINNNTVNAQEWTLSILFAVCAVILLLYFIRKFQYISRLAFLISAGAWAASAGYLFDLHHATIRARIGLGLINLGLALVCLFTATRKHESELG